jgi:hypothetical protein
VNSDLHLKRFAEVNGLTGQEFAQLRGILDLARSEATEEARKTMLSMAERITAQKEILERSAEKAESMRC